MAARVPQHGKQEYPWNAFVIVIVIVLVLGPLKPDYDYEYDQSPLTGFPPAPIKHPRQMPPLPNPIRRSKRLPWLAVPGLAAVFALTYHLAHPPELVWWTSPLLGNGGRRAKVLIPSGWRVR